MEGIDLSSPNPVVILANGEFPTHPAPIDLLKSAKTLICTDGSADKALRMGLSPKLVIGDLDSLESEIDDYPCSVLLQEGQKNTDLEKALDWCVENNIKEVTLLGATGDREDHTLTNLLVMKTYYENLSILMVTDYFEIQYIEGHKQFDVAQGRKVSLIPTEDLSSVRTTGLRFPLEGEPLISGGQGISNETVTETFSVTVDSGGLFLFISHP